METRSRHIGVTIDRPSRVVYDFAADPMNLPRWAAGLAGSEVAPEGDHWVTDSPMGRVELSFGRRNDLGVLDHDVRLPSGEVVSNPLRVISDGDACEVVFTLRRRPGMSEEDFAADARAVEQDLATLKALLES